MLTPNLLAAALEYAASGWPVFPCHSRTKRPLTPRGEDAKGKVDGSGRATPVLRASKKGRGGSGGGSRFCTSITSILRVR
jgi:Bifunctional DNA primase/polymerase, N-terminal